MFSSSTQVTTVTGTIDSMVDIDPATGAASALTFTGGDLSMSDVRFQLNLILYQVDLQTAGMGGTVDTPAPPAPVIPAASGGIFDASLHRLLINRGTMTGDAGGTPVNTDFATTPTAGTGSGTGSLSVVPGSSSSTHRSCATTLILPVDFSDTQDLNGIAVTTTVHGTIKAVGNVFIPLKSWIDWTQQVGMPGAPFGSPAGPGAAPLGLAWAAGLEPETPAVDITPVARKGPGGVETAFTLPPTGSRAPLWVEVSHSLAVGSWVPAAAGDVSGGANPVPAGSQGSFAIQSGGGPATFVRLRADAP